MRRAALFTLFALLSAFPASAAPFEIGPRLNLDTLAAQTGLSPVPRPLVLNRGHTLSLLAGMRARRAAAYLIRLRDYAPSQPSVSIGNFPGTPALVFYDLPQHQAGLLITRRSGRAYAHHLGLWDLRRRRLTGWVELSRATRTGQASAIRPIGYQPVTQRFYAAELRVDPGGRSTARLPKYRVKVLSVTPQGDLTVLTRFDTARRIHDVYPDLPHRRALIAEYAEAPVQGPAPVGWLINLDTGRRDTVPLPPTAYGAAFSTDGRTLYVYSSQTGTLRAINLQTHTATTLHRAGGLGHTLGLVDATRLLLVRNSAIQLLDTATGRPRGSLSTRKLFASRFRHTEGSQVAANQALVKNGADLTFVRVVAAR